MALMYNKILVALDGSKEADWSFKKAIDIAKRNQSQLILAHIIDNRSFPTVEVYDTTISEQAESYVNKFMDKYRQEAVEAGVPSVILAIDYGSPKVKIPREMALEYGVDLIICGATGLNMVERFFIGSVSEHITRYAPCDVLVVRTHLHD
ncbi:nucleotide-binding universal stress UspA family protein [Peribacillus deserti]|uniref:Universal stress protein n=1 Tax=Peribacillus deserti TaxID=673318 RepID=A0ABS2QI98_9BACI|nr:universal stress protein [Peribacillus deserti]MBM7692885.1 nucleotide-binding universal stress UspA family protein [Peribacillus deserti]